MGVVILLCNWYAWHVHVYKYINCMHLASYFNSVHISPPSLKKSIGLEGVLLYQFKTLSVLGFSEIHYVKYPDLQQVDLPALVLV